MRVFWGLGDVPGGCGPSAVAVGKFDGVHRGHQEIVRRLVVHARERAVRSVVVTFDRNPLEVLRPESCPEEVMPLSRRCELLEDAGVEAVLILRFTREFAAQAPEVFIDEVLLNALGARVVLAGEDFRFGFRGAGDLSLLERRGAVEGFDVEAVPPVVVDGQVVSSTRIRRALAEGEVRHASALLGRPPEVSGVVVHGAKRGRELGFPTANLGEAVVSGRRIPVAGLIPADGVYAGWAVPLADAGGCEAGDRLPAAISVGTNPTFSEVPRTVEAHILDRTLDLYGCPMRVEFVDFLRPMVAFSSREDLIAGMREDVARCRDVLVRIAQ